MSGSDEHNTLENISSDSQSPISKSIRAEFVENMEDVFCSGRFADLTIKTTEETATPANSFEVHKCILEGRSEYFRNYHHFDRITEIHVPDFDLATLKDLFLFIYSGKTPPACKMTLDLLAAADKYLMKSLHAKCQQRLKGEINIENAFEILHASVVHNAPELRQHAEEFFHDNREAVILTEGYEKFKTMEMIDALLKQSVSPPRKIPRINSAEVDCYCVKN